MDHSSAWQPVSHWPGQYTNDLGMVQCKVMSWLQANNLIAHDKDQLSQGQALTGFKQCFFLEFLLDYRDEATGGLYHLAFVTEADVSSTEMWYCLVHNKHNAMLSLWYILTKCWTAESERTEITPPVFTVPFLKNLLQSCFLLLVGMTSRYDGELKVTIWFLQPCHTSPGKLLRQPG